MTGRYRVVVEGIGDRSGEVASSPMTYDDAQAGLPTVLAVFSRDIDAGQMRVSLLSEDDYQHRLHRGEDDR